MRRIERALDALIVEASKDTAQGAGRRSTPDPPGDHAAGVVANQIRRCSSSSMEQMRVIPAILGYGRTFLIGNALVDAFIQTRSRDGSVRDGGAPG
ncbi:MAG: hypothetical protein U0838_10375 [Chloroflexota bacterium]